MTQYPIRVKGFTYDLDLQHDVLRKIEFVLEDDTKPLTYEEIYFNRDRVYEFYSAWKNATSDASQTYTDKLKLADDAYIEFTVIDEFEGRVVLVLERDQTIRLQMPMFFMEFESVIFGMLEEEEAYEYSE